MGNAFETFRAKANDNFDKPAIISLNSVSTYGDLLEKALDISIGLNKGEKVAIFLPQGEEPILMALSALAANAIFIPFDFNLPHQELEKSLEYISADLLVIPEGYANPLNASTEVSVHTISSVRFRRERKGITLPSIDRDIAYAIRTSGTTGLPKFVVQSAENFMTHIENYGQSISMTKDFNISLISLFSYDAGIMDTFVALLNGATLHIYPLGELYFDALFDWANSRRIDVLHCTPTVLRLAYKTSRTRKLKAGTLVLGGEQASKSDYAIFVELFSPHSALINGLGPSECTVAFQKYLLPSTDLRLESLPIGRPVDGVFYELVGLGDEGTNNLYRLVIISDLLALGYWEEGGQNVRELPRRPHTRRNEFLTDDIVYLQGSDLVHYGRIGSSVKFKGSYINLDDLKVSILDIQAINNVHCFMSQDGGQETLVCAYSHSADDFSSSTIVRHLSQFFPRNQIPNIFYPVREWPFAANGKTDIRSLLEDYDRHRLKNYSGSVRGGTYEVVMHVFSSTLQVENLDCNSNFFESGGDSLMIVELLLRLNSDLAAELTLLDIIRDPTPRGIAKRVFELGEKR